MRIIKVLVPILIVSIAALIVLQLRYIQVLNGQITKREEGSAVIRIEEDFVRQENDEDDLIELSSEGIKAEESDQKEETDVLIEEPLQEVHITISGAGDCTLGTDERHGLWGSFISEAEKQKDDYGYFFENVRPIFAADDLTIVNLEGPLTNQTEHMDKPFVFRGKPEYTEILKQGSVEAVNLANNHTHDFLEQGYRDTINALEQAGIGYFGYEHHYITEIKGIKVGALGYKGWDSGKWIKNKIQAEMEALRPKVDLLIISFHWGDEGTNYPNEIQKDLGRFAVDQGADLVLGHHPHVIQGIENYKDKYIVYSLGNFSFGGNRNPKDKDTFIFQQTFTFLEGHLIGASEKNIIPCSISSIQERNDFRPTPYTGEEAKRVLKRIEEYSKGF